MPWREREEVLTEQQRELLKQLLHEQAHQPRFIAHLPQGTVELVGIASGVASAQSIWWRADGSPAPARMREFAAKDDLSAPNAPRLGKVRSFVVRLTNLPGDASRPAWRMEPSAAWRGGEVVDARGTVVPDTKMLIATFSPSTRVANFRVGVSSGAWETVITQKADGVGVGTSSFTP